MANTSSVTELVLRWQEQRDQGRTVSAEELCADCPGLLDDLRRQLQALASMEQFLGASAGGAAGAAAPEDGSPLVGSRYRPLRLHARGGLGEVYLARDEELSREVALKRMRRPHAGNADSRRRFLREGEITGGLEHPGVVPVYGLTRDADGQPCYAMRFVRGQTLQEAIRRFHAAPEAGRGLALRQLLSRFVAVCNTIAYAHSRGVVHRDLKPANIMLGDYGETLVVDWGLAKRLDVPGEAQPPDGDGLPHAPAGGHEDGTATGDVLGTPAFMSPEQATGRPDAVGPASDVYGLGATLYALLTGRPPFTGDSVGEVLHKVERGDFPPPRQLRPDTPRALEAICLKAMAREPAARYATALALAADLERWLADEPVSAYREPWAARARRRARRHRTLVASVASALLLALLLGGAAGLWWWRQRTELRSGVEAGLDQAAELRDAGRWGEARAVLDQLANRLGTGGPADLSRRLQQAGADLGTVTRLEAIRLQRLRLVHEKFDDASADRDYEEQFRPWGLAVGQDAEEAAGRIRGSAVRSQLVSALDDWEYVASDPIRRAWLMQVARLADPDPWRDKYRDAVARRNGLAMQQLAAEADVAKLSPHLLASLGVRLKPPEAVALLTRAQRVYPNDFWLNQALTDKHWALGHLEETIAYSRAALALRPDAVAILANLGVVFREKKQPDEAIAYFRMALDLDPRDAYSHNNLGVVLQDKGQLGAAIPCYLKAIELRPDYAMAYQNLGTAYARAKRLDEAVGAYLKALELLNVLERQPGKVEAHAGGAEAYCYLGDAYTKQGKYEDAVRAFGKGRELDSRRPNERLRPAEWLRQAERYVVLDKELPAVLAGTADPVDAAHLMELARFGTHQKRRFVEVAALLERCFARHPEWAAGQGSFRPRTFAAVTAAMAAGGEGQEPDRLDEAARRRLREQARFWYRADLDAWTAVLERGTATEVKVLREQLQYWKVDGWGSSVRDEDSLKKLPPAERAHWGRLWADVDDLLQRSRAGRDGVDQGGPRP